MPAKGEADFSVKSTCDWVGQAARLNSNGVAAGAGLDLLPGAIPRTAIPATPIAIGEYREW